MLLRPSHKASTPGGEAKGRNMLLVRQRKAQRGSFLVEFSVALILSAIVGIYASNQLQQAADDSTAAATGVYLDNLAQAGQRYILKHYSTLSATSGDVPDVANDLVPTIPELITMGRLPPAFPTTTPTRQAAQINLTKSSCPGPSCQIIATACLTSGLTVRGKTREDLATTAMVAMQGRGGRSHADAPAVIRGPSLTASNPMGAVNAIVCGQSLVDAGLYDTFLRMGDDRDPILRGGLTVTGTNGTGEALRVSGDLAVVDPASGNICVQILKGGTINVNCAGQINAATGTFTGPAGTVKVGGTGTNYTVDTAGRIRAEAGFWTAMGSAFGDNTLGVRAAGTVFTIQTNAGVDAFAVHDSGRTGARTSVATPVLGLTDAVSAGTACTSAAAQVGATQVTTAATTVLRAMSGGGLATCDSATGTWVSATATTATEAAACAPNGAIGQTLQGVAMICTRGLWTSLTDRTGYTIQAEMWRVVDGSVVAKPNCGSGSTGTRLLLQAGNEQQNIQFVNRSHVDNGASWTVSLRNGNGATIAGDMIATSYCLY
jgi:hypothetical protein